MNELIDLMEDRGLSRSDIIQWIEEEYAPVSDSLNFSMLTPTMVKNLKHDIEEGKLEHLEG